MSNSEICFYYYLDFLNRILKLTELSMQMQRSGVLGGVTHGEQCGNGEVFGQAQGTGDVVCIEIAHPAGADSQFEGLEHHVGADDGCVGLAGLITGLQLVLPIPVAVIAHHQDHGGVKGTAADRSQLLAGFFALGYENLLGLIVASGGCHTACLQNQIHLLIFNGLILERTDRITLTGKFLKCHGNDLLGFFSL